MRKTLSYLFFQTFFCLILLSGCHKTGKFPQGEQKPIVLVTIPPYGFLVDQISGKSVQVISVVPPGTNLHIFEPTPKEVTQMGNARLWIRIGEPFERKIFDGLRDKNPTLATLNLWEETPLLETHDQTLLGPCSNSSHDLASQDYHFWMSPKTMLFQARLILDALSAIFPENQDFFRQNFQELENELEILDKEIEEILAPFKGSALLVSHAAMGYFCHDYHLIQLAVECEGKEPKPKDISALLLQAKKQPILCVLTQEGFNNKGAELIAKELKLPVYLIDPFKYDYPQNMLSIAKRISQ